MPNRRIPLVLGALAAAGLIAFGLLPLNRPPELFEQDVAELAPAVKAGTAFALDLHGTLSGREGNLLFSPFSVHAALAMTHAGARGATAEELGRALGFPKDDPAIHARLGLLLRHLGGKTVEESGYGLVLANRLWGQRRYPFDEAFLKLTERQFGAGLEQVDFEASSSGARERINAWVSERTRQRIKELVKDGTVDASTRLVLVNAVWFKGTWEAPFKKAETHDAPFHPGAGRPVQVPMMCRQGWHRYRKTEALEILELPYKGGEVSLVVFLPGAKESLSDFEKKLTPDVLRESVEDLSNRQVDVFIPRFTVRSEFQLSSALRVLGVKDAFDPARADFSGMVREKQPDLFLREIVHQALVDVDEEGTEAAAATAAVMVPSARPPDVAVFRADRPFLFFILERRTGTILFMGRFARP